ncbi:P-loop containing nucleoside triphosphate hydrolase protein [Pavlovales sp. CCMP2436]|nr:P-loop containing nucleoside triphosphate hydrolase protein [Pavlovales sp. CCMP2436]
MAASTRDAAWSPLRFALFCVLAGAAHATSSHDGPLPDPDAAERAAERARASIGRAAPARVQLAEGRLPPLLGAGRPLPQAPPARVRMESISGDPNTQLGIPELAARLKKLYKEKLLPLEQLSLYADFYGSCLTDSHFDSRPMVLLIGPYSVGKTSFIKYLLGRSFPGERIGPEPTTDRFIVVMQGSEDRSLPGNALAASPETPFQPLSMFGTQFLNKLEAAQLNAPILQRLTLVDTPGVLSGERQREMRGYDMYKVTEWFIERADRVLLLFDASKLDMSDEFKRVIQLLHGHEDKVRLVLNKADATEPQELMRVYGALMWSLGSVVQTPEVIRVFMGSFWDKPFQHEGLKDLFLSEERDLVADLLDLPRNAAVSKINELVKRARLVKVHAALLTFLHDAMPSVFGREATQKRLLANMLEVFKRVQQLHKLPPGDFPDLEKFTRKAAQFAFSELPRIPPRRLQLVDELLEVDVPELLQLVRQHQRGSSRKVSTTASLPHLKSSQVKAANGRASGEQWKAVPKRDFSGGAAGGGTARPSAFRPSAPPPRQTGPGAGSGAGQRDP